MNIHLKTRLYQSFVSLLIFVAILLFIFPTLLSLSLFKPIVEHRLSHMLQGTVKIENIHMSWFTSQSIEGFEYRSADGAHTLTFKSLKISSNLFQYFITPHLYHLAEPPLTELSSPMLTVHLKNLSATQKQTNLRALLPFLQNLSITEGSFLCDGEESATLSHIQAHMKIQDKIIHLSAQGGSWVQETPGHLMPGHFDIECAFTKGGTPQTLSVACDHFPVISLEALLNKKGTLSALLGTTFNAKCLLNAQHVLTLETTSPHLTSYLEAELHEELITLTKPATLSLIVTPEAFNILKTASSLAPTLSLTRNASCVAKIDSLIIPYTDSSVNWRNLFYEGKIECALIALTFPEALHPLSVNNFTLSSHAEPLSQSLEINLQSSFNYYLKTPSYLSAGCKLEQVFSQNLMASLSDVHLEAIKLPTALLDAALSKDKMLTTFFGDSLNLKLSSHHEKTQEKTPYALLLSSPRLQIPELLFAIEDTLTLLAPAQFTYTPDSTWISDTLPKHFVSLSNQGKIEGSLESFEYVLDPLKHSHKNPLTLSCHLHTGDVDVYPELLSGVFTCKNISLSLNTADASHLSAHVTASLSYFDERADALSSEELFGTPMLLEMKTTVAMHSPWTLSPITCRFYNTTNNISATFALEEHFRQLTFLKPIHMQLQLQGDNLHLWTRPYQPSLSYVFSPATLSCDVKPLDLTKPLRDQFSLEAQISLPQASLVDKVFLREFSLSSSKSTILLDAPQHLFKGSFETQIKTAETPAGSFSCHIDSSLSEKLQITSSYKHLPTSLLDTLCGYKNALYILMGNTVEGTLALERSQEEFSITSEALSPHMSLKGSLIKNQEGLSLKTPLEGALKLSTQSLSTLEQLSGNLLGDITLTSPTLMSFVAKDFHWPIQGPLFSSSLKDSMRNLAAQLNQAYFHLILKADHAHLLFKSSNNVATKNILNIQDLLLECSKEHTTSPLTATLNSSVTDIRHLPGGISASLTLQRGKDFQGKPVLLSKCQAQLKQFPTLCIDTFFQMLGFQRLPPSTLLGEEINATIDTDLENLSGHLDVQVNATDSQGNLNAILTDGALKLYKPIQATLNITPALASFFLKNMNISLSLAKNPLKLFISEQGFYFPVEQFDISKVQIRRGNLNLGKILCDNRGNPSDINTFFKLKQKDHYQLSLWFAPIDFTMSRGTLQMDRTETLFNDAYQIAFWGRIDFVKNYVNMTLGLTEQSLSKALGIRGLPKSFVLQIPMTGPTHNVKINTEVATTRIAFLLAKSSGLTDHAGLWGDIVNTLGEFANDQVTVPPARPPFPWDEHLSQYEVEEKKRNTSHILH